MTGLTEGLDPAWLQTAAAKDPFAHAYAVWDRTHEPERTRFVSVQEGREVRAYLLIYRSPRAVPIVHWVGSAGVRALLDALPPRPFLGVFPSPIVEEIRDRRGPIATFEVELRALADSAPAPAGDGRARRLSRADSAAVRAFATSEPERLLEGYVDLDLDGVPVYGAFEGARLVAIAKASVVLRPVWILSGIVTAADQRGRGFGRAVTQAAVRACVAAGARPGLYVRSDNAPAVGLYDSLGFVPLDRRSWVDAGAGRSP